MTTHEERISAISAMRFTAESKFSAKLDFDQRCEILALHRAGISRVALAEAYGLDRRTVTHIYNPKSTHYKTVRAELEKLGPDEFQRRYITDNALTKLKNISVAEGAKEGPMAQKNATRFKGVHSVMNDAVIRAHRIIVAWREKGVDGQPAGWYYQDMDGDDPNVWRHNGDDSRMTSKACLEAVRENLVEI